jgi:hypothetical protein
MVPQPHDLHSWQGRPVHHNPRPLPMRKAAERNGTKRFASACARARARALSLSLSLSGLFWRHALTASR